MTKHRYIYKSSATGRFVSAAFVKANPNTTYRQRVATDDVSEEAKDDAWQDDSVQGQGE